MRPVGAAQDASAKFVCSTHAGRGEGLGEGEGVPEGVPEGEGEGVPDGEAEGEGGRTPPGHEKLEAQAPKVKDPGLFGSAEHGCGGILPDVDGPVQF